jgi:hypothetical protein
MRIFSVGIALFKSGCGRVELCEHALMLNFVSTPREGERRERESEGGGGVRAIGSEGVRERATERRQRARETRESERRREKKRETTEKEKRKKREEERKKRGSREEEEKKREKRER